MADAKSKVDISSATQGIDDFEEKIREKEMRNEAIRELNDEFNDDGALEEEFKKLESSQPSVSGGSAVDDELAMLKQQLLEDKGSDNS